MTHLRFAWWAGDDRELAVWCRGPKIFPASLCRSVLFNIPISFSANIPLSDHGRPLV